jgi:hypothetical protein
MAKKYNIKQKPKWIKNLEWIEKQATGVNKSLGRNKNGKKKTFLLHTIISRRLY